MINNLKILCVIQARMSSTRLPNKALADLNGVPAIIRMINRVALYTLFRNSHESWVYSINDKGDSLNRVGYMC